MAKTVLCSNTSFMKLFPFYCLLFTLLGTHFVNAQTIAELDAKLQEVATAHKLKGISASVRFADGSVWNHAVGKDGADKNLHPDMLFEMGSITKSFTASIILQLTQEGKLSLNDSLHRFFDTLVNIDSSITIKQLLNHTSGIFSYEDNLTLAGSVIIYPDKVWNPRSILRQFIEPMLFEAGTSWAYSNTNYLLLGLIIEQIEERSYHESVRKRLLEPLGLEHCYIEPNESHSEERALSWLTSGKYQDNVSEAILSAAWSAGALVATTKNVAVWAEALYGNELLGSAQTNLMLKNVQIGTRVFNYGLGTSLSTHGGYTILGHNGNTVLQHANMSYCPDLGISLAFAINQEGADEVLEEVKKDLLDYLFSKPWGLGASDAFSRTPHFYPNPATQVLQITQVSTPQRVCVCNRHGAEVLRAMVEGSTSMDVSGLVPGYYVVSFSNPDGSIISREPLLLR